ncbi:MAG: phosphoribosylformylglycinamidine synthase subunit PurL [Cyanobacteria bacterium P01_F01_bin.42]
MSPSIDSPYSPEEIASEGLKPEEYQDIVNRLGRHPNHSELGMFGVMWSEHCCYKNSRPLLSQFPTTGKHVLVGPGENAGVVDVGDGVRLVFKVESHNHPSAVEPFQGAATGVGGILRDIFTMGARPMAILNSLRFGSLDEPRNQRLVQGVVAGISHYGNCVGVPTVGGEAYFDPSYNGNPLVNAMGMGLMETEDIVKAGASGIGNPVLYVGSTTGRDGMGGASFASAELSDESEADRPAVQVGDPFLEKSLIEACLEAFKTGYVVAAQDMGAAGLTCSTAEMAAKGGVGIDLDLDKIPVRETGMVPYEYLLSESQERMLFVVEKGKEQALIDIFQRWDLHAVIAGSVIEEPIVRIRFQGETAAEIPALALSDNTPIYKRELLTELPDYVQEARAWSADELPNATAEGIEINQVQHDWSSLLLRLLDVPSIASKRWIYRQYDYQVQNNTVVVPGGADAAILRIRALEPQASVSSARRGVAASIDCNSRYVFLDPYEGAKATVAEAARNLSCVGAEPIAITDNLNFGSPENPVGYWQLANACQGLSEACEAFETPVTGGNVSLYNETLDSQGTPTAIYPTPVVGMVGLVPDLDKICGQGWQIEGDLIYLLGTPSSVQDEDTVSLGGSEYLAAIHGTVAGRPPLVDFDLERRVQETCRTGIRAGWVQSAHDCAEGGIAVAIAECCISAKLGANVQLSPEPSADIRFDRLLFGEGGARIIVSVAPSNQQEWEKHLAEQLGEHWENIGTVCSLKSGMNIAVKGNLNIIKVSIDAITQQWTQALEKRLIAT